MPDDPSAPQPTPTNYQRTTGGGHLRWVPPTPEHLQEMLPTYEIVSILGQGGMGAVYKGRQKSLDRIVAIKILPPEAGEDDMQFVERFKNEARTMAKMNHPAIVHVYDFGETSEGQLYIVMEFIDGTDVAQMIQSQGKLPENYALSITAHVCDALQYAHTHGVVHRDIKPANVLINREGQVKVADFGLAKATDPSQMGLTKTNMAMGTPDFVSPEALMPGVPLDGRADLYAVGVMLYNMLTGTIPRGAFRMPSTTLNTDARFDKIILKAMEMDRELRYQTALDLRRDLDVILTTPAAKTGVQTIPAQQAAPPKQSLPQKPMGRGPGSQQQPARSAPAADKSVRAPAQTPKKSNAGMIYGIAAAIVLVAVAAFMFAGGGKKPASTTTKVVEESEPESKSAAPKVEPSKPTATSAPSSKVFTFGGHRYQLLTEQMTWDVAKTKAKSMGGHLVTITSKAEADFVRDKFLSQVLGLTSNVGLRRLLLGGMQPNPGSAWQWVTGEPFEMSMWVGMQSDPKGNEPHYLNWDYGAKRWDHSTARGGYYPVIEWDDDGATQTAPVPVADASAPVGKDGEKWVDGLAQWFGGAKTHDAFTRKPGEAARVGKVASMRPLPDSAPLMRDMAVRARVRLGDAQEASEVALSVRSTTDASGEASSYNVKFEAQNQRVRLGYNRAGTYQGFIDYKLPADFDFTTPHTLELRVVGDLLTVTLDGKKLGERRDSLLTAGHPVLRGSKAWIESFEYADLGTSASAPAVVTSAQPGDVLTFAGHRYQIITEKLQWDAAKAKAEAMGGHLATITSLEEYNWVWGQMVSKLRKIDNDSDTERCFIGALNPRFKLSAPESGWEWVTGESFTVQPWMGTLSNDQSNGDKVLAWVPGKRWDDVTRSSTGSKTYFSLVEWDDDGSKPAPVATSAAKPFDVLTFGGHRYQLVAEKRKWDEAKTHAESLGGHLATITSQEESDWLMKNIKTPPDRDRHIFIGGQQLEQGSNWSWITGEPFDMKLWPGKGPDANGMKLTLFLGDNRWDDVSSITSNYMSLIEWDDDGKGMASPPADPRLAQLEAGYQARYESDAQKPFLAAVATLNQSYVANGIGKMRATAQSKGALAEITALDAEKALVETGGSVPAEDAAGTPDSLKGLRGTYRTAYAKIVADRDAKAAPLRDLYVKALDAYVTELTKAGKLDEAKQVQALRDAKATQKPGGEVKEAPQQPIIAERTAKKLFNGTNTEGWRYQGPQEAFVVEDGCIKATGPRGNLMFMGNRDVSPIMEDFDLSMKVKTEGNANSGVFVHCRRNNDGVSFGNSLEVQIANENKDPQKTGSFWSVQPVDSLIVHDGDWFDFRITVRGMTITSFINGKQVNEWTQPSDWKGAPGKPEAKLSEGTIGLQSNGGKVWFKDIEITQP